MNAYRFLLLPLAGLALAAAVGEGRSEDPVPSLAPAGNPSAKLNEALLAAAADGDEAAVRRLLEAGADANMRTDGCTALYAAAERGYTEVVRQLLAAGADVDAKRDPDDASQHALAGALPPEIVASLKDERGTARAPLHAAAANGHAEVIRCLLEAGADVNATNDAGVTPLRRATLYARPEAAELLRDHGGKE